MVGLGALHPSAQHGMRHHLPEPCSMEAGKVPGVFPTLHRVHGMAVGGALDVILHLRCVLLSSHESL